MRTTQEILDRIKLTTERDMFGFEWHEYLAYLSFNEAKGAGLLKDDATDDGWVIVSRRREDVLVQMKDYMAFAWGKANDCRGISANRAICHYVAWTWMAGDDAVSNKLADCLYGDGEGDYNYYGKPQLVEIADHYGWPWADLDDGKWRQSESGPWLSTIDALNKMGRSSPLARPSAVIAVLCAFWGAMTWL